MAFADLTGDGFLSSIELVDFLSDDDNSVTTDDYVIPAAAEDNESAWTDADGATLYWPDGTTEITMDNVDAAGFEPFVDSDTGLALYFYNSSTTQLLTDSNGKLVLGEAAAAITNDMLNDYLKELPGASASTTDNSDLIMAIILYNNTAFVASKARTLTDVMETASETSGSEGAGSRAFSVLVQSNLNAGAALDAASGDAELTRDAAATQSVFGLGEDWSGSGGGVFAAGG